MNRTNERKTGATPETLVISRTFPAPRERVFEAWSSAAHMKRWFSPEGCNVPEAEIDFRPGGICAICMRTPEGRDYWSRGAYIEISPPDRLVFLLEVSVDGAKKVSVHTTVTFEEDGAGTRMTVRQAHDVLDESFLSAIEGAREGWRTTLDKLQREVARIRDSQDRPVVHAVFRLERVYDASPRDVFHAFSDKAAKARWFGGGENYTVIEREMDVRSGGRERVKGRWASGVVSIFDAVYFDVAPNARIVYAYEMSLDDVKVSVSLATIEIAPAGAGARITVTEQGAFLDGKDDGSRERGTGFLLDRLGASLKG